MNKAKDIALFIVNKLYLIAAILLVLFAILVSLARAMTPILNHYRGEVNIWAEKMLSKPVHIGHIRANWRGLQPVIDLQDVSIFNKPGGKVLFHVKDLQAGLDLQQLIFQHKFALNRLFIDGINVVLTQQKNKQWSFKGMSFINANQTKHGNTSESFDAVSSWLLVQPELVFENINIDVKEQAQPTRFIHNLNVILTNSGQEHHLRGQADLGYKQNSPVDVAVDFRGSKDDINRLHGEMFFQGSRIPLHNWVANKSLYGFRIHRGLLNFKAWAHWSLTRLSKIQTEISLTDMDLSPIKARGYTYFNQLAANIEWKRLSANNGWNVSADNVHIVMNNHPWKTTKFSIWLHHPNQNNLSQVFETDYIRANDLYYIMTECTLIPKATRSIWQHLKPQGTISNVEFNHIGSVNTLGRFYLSAKFNRLGLQTYKSIPEFSNLTGSLTADQDTGKVTLQSTQASLNYPKLFAQPFDLNNIDGLIEWQNNKNNVQVQGMNVNLSDNNVSMASNFELDIPKNKKTPKISLLAHLHENNLSEFHHYLPTKIMPKKLAYWLSHAFVAGKSVEAGILLKGNLNEYPFVNNKGQYIVDAKIKNLRFQFSPGWQPITHLDTRLVLHKDNMFIHVQKGKVAGQPIRSLNANIINMNRHPQSFLNINSQVDIQDLMQAKKFILNSPIADTAGASIKNLIFTGGGKLKLQLKIPLAHGATDSNGWLTFANNKIAIASWGLDLSKVDGAIHFSNKDFSSNGLSANLLGNKSKIKISTRYYNNVRNTLFNVASSVDVADVKRIFSLKQLPFITGKTTYKALLSIGGGQQQLSFSSALQGVNVKLPKPYGKTSQQQQQFRADAYFSNNSTPLIRLSYGKLLGGMLAFTKVNKQEQFSRAIVHFGTGGYTLQKQPGVFVTGNLSQFIWQDWQPLLQPYLNSAKTNTTKAKTNNGLREIKLSIDHLSAFQQNLYEVALDIKRLPNEWALHINSDLIDGDLTVPNSYRSQTVVGKFSKLHITTSASQVNVDTARKTINPNDLIPVSLQAEDVHYGDHVFNRVNIELRKIKNGVRVNKLELANDLYELNTQGAWTENGNMKSSVFSGQLSSQDLGKLLSKENITTHFYKGNANFNFNLAWPDSPLNFQTKELQGTVTANISKGSIVGLDKATNQKIGLGKLLNVFSLQSLSRRLMLNFSDLGEQGFEYNVMKGDLMLKQGSIYTDDFYLDGPVAEIYAKGSLALKQELYDLNIRISPYYTSSLPLIATIAGGPVVGVATWAVSKVARVGVEKVASSHYKVTGPWNDPTVSKVTS